MRVSRISIGVGMLLLLSSCQSQPQAAQSPTGEVKRPQVTVAVSEKNPLKKEKLQIVFCFGQSNTVGI